LVCSSLVYGVNASSDTSLQLKRLAPKQTNPKVQSGPQAPTRLSLPVRWVGPRTRKRTLTCDPGEGGLRVFEKDRGMSTLHAVPRLWRAMIGRLGRSSLQMRPTRGRSCRAWQGN
jgi:hypothetical protein